MGAFLVVWTATYKGLVALVATRSLLCDGTMSQAREQRGGVIGGGVPVGWQQMRAGECVATMVLCGGGEGGGYCGLRADGTFTASVTRVWLAAG